ncbi:hypothetical protein TNCV_2177841 [Trichonephila clavipes]|uniref:Uncharacterized protein n=1 Tax=Trichonephila clavipes TaxID=2585209 RepID=A0A8X6VU37_TRICX|nr:hypothetical protein TNCV_2177841 [Trichonephila clavipes]
MRLPLLRSQPLISGSSIAAFFVGVIAFSFPFEATLEENSMGLAVARSATYVTICHPESDLITAKEITKSSRAYKKIKTVKRKNNKCNAFQYFTQVLFFWKWFVIAAHSY